MDLHYFLNGKVLNYLFAHLIINSEELFSRDALRDVLASSSSMDSVFYARIFGRII